jgi:hypothetical protein
MPGLAYTGRLKGAWLRLNSKPPCNTRKPVHVSRVTVADDAQQPMAATPDMRRASTEKQARYCGCAGNNLGDISDVQERAWAGCREA